MSCSVSTASTRRTSQPDQARTLRYLGLESYAGSRPGQSQASLARFRTWIDSHTDQLIVVGSLIVGFWLIAKSIYLIVG